MSQTSRRKSPIRSLRLESLESRQLLTVLMTAEEQLMIELVNRARADPLAEAERNDWELNRDVEEDELISEDPKQPLAPHQSLVDAAGGHSEDMLLRNYFGHDSPEGETPSDRAMDAGYPRGAGENIAWAGNSGIIDEIQEVYDRQEGLFESVGHRLNMMRDNWREIGAGVRFGTFTQDSTDFKSIMVGTLFGNRGGNYFITGVAITDHVVRNHFYEIGEGIGEVTITAVHEGTGASYSDVTGPTGGYGIQAPKGIYTVTASGGRFQQPVTVRGVQVNGANVKVDFNRAGMPTRYISGSVFEDSNGNGTRDAREQPSVGQTVYLDYDDDDTLDDGEPSTQTDADGHYRFDELLPGKYFVRLELPPRSDLTLPTETYDLTLADRHVAGADFGIQSQNIPPIAIDDEATLRGGDSAVISVLRNDFDPDGSLEVSTLRIVAQPEHGIASIDSRTGGLKFVAADDFVGVDTVAYTISDTEGTVSNIGTVRITITPAYPWHNPRESLDVNDDGFIVSQDVLLIVREINRGGAGSLVERVREDDSPFYDVNGDNFLSPLDALRVIRYLNAQAAAAQPPPESPSSAAADILFALAGTQSSQTDEDRFKL